MQESRGAVKMTLLFLCALMSFSTVSLLCHKCFIISPKLYLRAFSICSLCLSVLSFAANKLVLYVFLSFFLLRINLFFMSFYPLFRYKSIYSLCLSVLSSSVNQSILYVFLSSLPLQIHLFSLSLLPCSLV